jgi:hypothetical protein
MIEIKRRGIAEQAFRKGTRQTLERFAVARTLGRMNWEP